MKLPDKMYEYEMDPTRTVEATARTWDAGRTRDERGTDGRTDGQTDGRTELNQYTPQQLRCAGGIITKYHKWSKLYECNWIHSVYFNGSRIEQNNW